LSTGSEVPLKGIAFAGARGVSGVEVSFDDGQSWQGARVVYQGVPMAWILWSHDWPHLQPGTYTLVVRATDATGALQTAKERNTDPEGATGYHRITVRVEA
jgi:hypothetical protein